MKDRIIMDTFKDYVGIKLHFNDPKFNYTSRNQLNRYTVDTLKKRKDTQLFIKLAHKFELDPSGRIQFLISQFKNNKNAWVGDFFKESANSIHVNRMKIVKSFDYYLDTDIDKMINYYQGVKSLEEITKVNFDRPLIYKDLTLNDETYAMLDMIVNFEEQSVNPLWQENLLMYRKYKLYLPLAKYKDNVESKLKDGLIVASVNQAVDVENTLDHLFL